MFNITINFENNKDFLAAVNHKRFLDLAIAKVENASDYALELKDLPLPDDNYVIRDMGGFVKTPFKVITNRSMTFGANVITNTDFLSEVYEALHGEFFIIPSSIHEVLALPCKEFPNTEDVVGIKNIINEVNTNEVISCERLSDNLYKFDGKKVAIVA